MIIPDTQKSQKSHRVTTSSARRLNQPLTFYRLVLVTSTTLTPFHRLPSHILTVNGDEAHSLVKEVQATFSYFIVPVLGFAFGTSILLVPRSPFIVIRLFPNSVLLKEILIRIYFARVYPYADHAGMKRHSVSKDRRFTVLCLKGKTRKCIPSPAYRYAKRTYVVNSSYNHVPYTYLYPARKRTSVYGLGFGPLTYIVV